MTSLTVLIPCTDNHKPYVHEAIRSCSYPGYDPGFRVIPKILYTDRPKSETLNNAMWSIETNYIAFLDADDYYVPYPFYNNIFFTVNGEYDIIYSDCIFIYQNNTRRYFKAKPFDRELLKKENYIPFSTIIVKTEIAKKFPIGNGYKGYGEDWVWLNQLAQAGYKFGYVPFPTVYKRQGWTSHFGTTNIPVVRKLIRKYRTKKVKEIINALT